MSSKYSKTQLEYSISVLKTFSLEPLHNLLEETNVVIDEYIQFVNDKLYKDMKQYLIMREKYLSSHKTFMLIIVCLHTTLL